MPWKPQQYVPPGMKSARERVRDYENTPERRADKAFYNSKLWRDFRRWFIGLHPLCVECEKQNRMTPTEHVDHIIDRKKAPDRTFDETNVQPLCGSCHTKKHNRGRVG